MSYAPDPWFVLRGGNDSGVNFVKFIRDETEAKSVLWTASADGKVRGWCLETMRPSVVVDAHPNVNGGAYWVDGRGEVILTQGRDGVVKRFQFQRAENEEEEYQKEDKTLKFQQHLNEEEDSGFCTCALTRTEDDNDSILAIPKRGGRVSLLSLRDDRHLVDFVPDSNLKLGMCMTIAFAKATIDNRFYRLLVGYEDGSVVVWGLSSSCSDSVSSSSYPLHRLKAFNDSTPVLSLDFDVRLGVGFCGSTDKRLRKFIYDEESLTMTEPFDVELTNEGVSFIKMRTFSDYPKLLSVGGWDTKIRILTVKSLKPLAVLDVHKKTIRSIDFDPFSGAMAVGSDDSHVSLWKLYSEMKK